MDIDRINEMIAQYEYGRSNILDKGTNIFYNPLTEQVKFDPIFDYRSLPKTGSCGELMNTAYLEIRNEFPEFHVTRVTGNDPYFFIEPDSTHCYLLLSKADLMDGMICTKQPEDIEEVISKNPLIADPSFKRVAHFSDSGYSAKKLMNQGCEVGYSNSIVLDNGDCIPLGFNSHEELVYLIVNFKYESLFKIGVQGRGKRIREFDLNSGEMESLFSDDPGIFRYIEFFREKEKYETRQDFIVDLDIFIE